MSTDVDTPIKNVELTVNAVKHFNKLLMAETESLNLRITIENPMTINADLGIEFCPKGSEEKNDLALEYDGFILYIARNAVKALEDAVIDYKDNQFGGELAVKAPYIKGKMPKDGNLTDRVVDVINNQINPSLKGHGGFISLQTITEEKEAVVKFGGGCQGCSMADITLKSSVQKTLMQAVPELAAVLDATDHANGQNPYY